MSGRSENRVRTTLAVTRLTPTERDELVSAAERLGLSVSALLRKSALRMARESLSGGTR